MTSSPGMARFFLGANTPSGFFSYYDQLIDPKTANEIYILKGGPGTGKSSFMQKIGAAMQSDGHDVEWVVCGSDPSSLDGVLIKDAGVAFMDGTAPHVMDPKYPGAVEHIINLGEYWDAEGLKKHRDEIFARSAASAALFDSAYRYLKAAKAIDDDSRAAVSPYVQRARLSALARRIIKKELPNKGRAAGRAQRRFLSAVTGLGVTPLFDSAAALCPRVYTLCDDYGLSFELLAPIAKAALERGYDTYECMCPLNPESYLEHLIIPELGLGFITSTYSHRYTKEAARSINLNRYIEPAALSKNRSRLRFNKKMAAALLESAADAINTSLENHLKLEAIYIEGMDFYRINALTKRLIDELREKYARRQ